MPVHCYNPSQIIQGIAVRTNEGVFEVRTLLDHAILQMRYDSTLEL